MIAFLTITNFNAQNLASLIEKYNENKNDEAIILEIGKKYADKKNWEKSIEYFQKLVDINQIMQSICTDLEVHKLLTHKT